MIKIPFYKNTVDDVHCFQAGLRMVLAYFFPNRQYSYKRLDKITGHKMGKWTWNGKTMLCLAKQGFKVSYISPFSYEKFAQKGENYLKNFWSKEVFTRQQEMSDLKYERQIAKQIFNKIKQIKTNPKLSHIKNYFSDRCVLLVAVNANTLDKKGGYNGHSVVITDYNEKKKIVTFHDPGLPPHKGRAVSAGLFQKAMLEIIVICKN